VFAGLEKLVPWHISSLPSDFRAQGGAIVTWASTTPVMDATRKAASGIG